MFVIFIHPTLIRIIICHTGNTQFLVMHERCLLFRPCPKSRNAPSASPQPTRTNAIRSRWDWHCVPIHLVCFCYLADSTTLKYTNTKQAYMCVAPYSVHCTLYRRSAVQCTLYGDELDRFIVLLWAGEYGMDLDSSLSVSFRRPFHSPEQTVLCGWLFGYGNYIEFAAFCFCIEHNAVSVVVGNGFI